MNDQMLITQFADQMDGSAPSRREALRKAGRLGAGLALAALPAAFLLPRTAFAQDVTGVLNYALTLEYLEESYYRQGLDSEALSGQATALEVYGLIQDHEEAHVGFLRAAIEGLGGTPVELTDDDFDFTAGGAFDPFGDYATFLLLSQAFEDTGVRAYKGQAGGLVGGGDLLTAALQIHSVEARHAAEVRRLRTLVVDADVEPWIVLDDATDGTPVEPVYDGEENIMQGGVDVTTFGYTAEEATGAFDEPLTMNAVQGIAALFLADS